MNIKDQVDGLREDFQKLLKESNTSERRELEAKAAKEYRRAEAESAKAEYWKAEAESKELELQEWDNR